MSVVVRDNGANALIATLGDASRTAVDVGVLGAKAGQAHGKTTTAQVAAWAEFGIGQPRRSWLGDWIESSIEALRSIQRAEFQKVVRGTQSIEQAQARVGVWIVGQIRSRIAAGIQPPNAPSTVAKKGSDTPLIDTGQLRSSIDSRVVK